MTTVSRSAIALALTLVFAAQPDAAFAVGASDAGPARAHHRHADPNKARALAAPDQVQPPATERVPETDGFSRNDEDCKFGCIDH